MPTRVVSTEGAPHPPCGPNEALLAECESDRTWIEATVASRENVPVIEGEKSFGVTY